MREQRCNQLSDFTLRKVYHNQKTRKWNLWRSAARLYSGKRRLNSNEAFYYLLALCYFYSSGFTYGCKFTTARTSIVYSVFSKSLESLSASQPDLVYDFVLLHLSVSLVFFLCSLSVDKVTLGSGLLKHGRCVTLITLSVTDSSPDSVVGELWRTCEWPVFMYVFIFM